MKNIFKICVVLVSIFFLQGCEEDNLDTSLSHISFGDDTYSAGVDVGGSTTVDVEVYATNIVGSDRSFNVVIDPSSNAAAGSYDVPSSVSIPSGSNKGVLTVGLSDVNLGIGVNKLIIGFTDVQGHSTGSATTIEYIQNCTEVSATLEFMFDAWGSEVGWSIIDALGGVVVSGGGYSDGQSSATENFALCAGRDYTLQVTDSYGDGGSGYTLTVDGIEKASSDGTTYTTGESTDFDTN